MRIGGVGVGGVQQRRRRRRGESAISSEIPQFQLREAHGTWPCGPGTMPHNEQPRLPALAVDPDRVSIGGISTGADLAANYLLAHSAST